MKEDRSKLIEVFNGALWKADLVKTMLGDNGIEATTTDGSVVNLVLPETAVEVGVWVHECDYEAAMEVIRAYESNNE